MPRLRNQKYVLQKVPWGRQRGVDPEPHDCRLNHVGSAKAMEGFIAVELCQKEQYQVLIASGTTATADTSVNIARTQKAIGSQRSQVEGTFAVMN
ncbi:hypothetical protein OS493_009053 [Desmophyllum pertusum]|uniref:Uncharacterized protein n=1 Tax=Desmophyllum pertusum TaxID=174260 RepID=A0A9W9ZFJ2_9CNID|nr:hypothetical protein OS493_009053 [Desmophyllum pertusum]